MKRNETELTADAKRKTEDARNALPSPELFRRFLNAIGLAARARRTVSGTDGVCAALKEKKAHLVVRAGGISANTSKRIADRCSYYGIKLISAEISPEDLAYAAGRQSPAAAVAVTDGSLAKAVLEAYGRYEDSLKKEKDRSETAAEETKTDN